MSQRGNGLCSTRVQFPHQSHRGAERQVPICQVSIVSPARAHFGLDAGVHQKQARAVFVPVALAGIALAWPAALPQA